VAENSQGSGARPGSPGAGKPFEKGKSGNPGGRSAERDELRRYIRESFGQTSIDGIEKLSREAASDKVKLAAYIWLAEQSVGRAVQAISGPDGEKLSIGIDFSSLTTEQLEQLESIRGAIKVKP
jgi:hypothetical protein